MSDGVSAIDALPSDEARARFLQCCGSRAWVEAMIAARPFATRERLHSKADVAWSALDGVAWLEAFAAHPRIGGAREVASKQGVERVWTTNEQAGAARASDDVKAAIAHENEAYEARFGFLFLICATGKSAEDLLAACRARQRNERDAELAIAAEEQRKILHLRLDKLTDHLSHSEQRSP
ncbi:MAG: 2-oxo-4-hydroxy-4-carboxy-5-ureidoimidazoline decarboxylase [Polyangiales bacterium]